MAELIQLTSAQAREMHALRRKGCSVRYIARWLFPEAKGEALASAEATVATHLGVEWPGAYVMLTTAERVARSQDKAEEARAAADNRKRVAEHHARAAAVAAEVQRRLAAERKAAYAEGRSDQAKAEVRERARLRMQAVRAAARCSGDTSVPPVHRPRKVVLTPKQKMMLSLRATRAKKGGAA